MGGRKVTGVRRSHATIKAECTGWPAAGARREWGRRKGVKHQRSKVRCRKAVKDGMG